MAKNEPRLCFLRFPPGFCFIQVLIQVRTSPYHPDRDRWPASLRVSTSGSLSAFCLSTSGRRKMFKSNSLRMDVEMESLQRYFLLSDEAEPEPGDKPQRLTAGARIGLETAWLDSSSSTECSGDRKRVVGKRDERAEFLCEMADRHLSTRVRQTTGKWRDLNGGIEGLATLLLLRV